MAESSRRIVKGYELRERIGAGGFGEVYRASQLEIGREVAIKVILPQHANQPDFIRRFETEAQLVARLEHPHIVPLYDYWRDPEGAYLVMRWLRSSLRASLAAGPWSLEMAARLLDQVAGALTVAHREGVIHRDIKPDNILLDEDDNAYLADFGIAVDTRTPSQPLITQVLSTSSITPEQIKGEAVTPRTDIYSLGVVLYELLTGETPYPSGTSSDALIEWHLHSPMPRVQSQRPGIPAAVDEVLQTATAKDPTQRYSSAARFAGAFRAAIPDSRRAAAQPLADPLTERELEILRRMVDGLSNSEIADRLFLSPGTVKWYFKQIYSKLDAHSRSQAVERAEALGLFSHPPTAAADPPTTPVIPAPVSTVELVNPYKGLRAFQESDAPDFFGREALTTRLLDRLGARFLAVVGPSGSGKSSVVKAGLLAALRQGRASASDRWFITEMVPGTHPFEELEAALLRVSVNPLPGIVDSLSSDERGLARAAKRILPADSEAELLLVIDQFEELFTLSEDGDIRRRLIDTLLSAVTDPRGRVRLVLTLRADFYDRPLMFPALAELMRANTEVIVPLSAEEIERAISGPAERVGLTLESGLIATMVKDVGEQAGTLPLLEYALSELYERRDGTRLTLDAYRQTGGISGALARRADELYQALDIVGQAAARQLFLRLITLGEGVEDTRRRVLQSELDTLLDDVVMDDITSAFGQYRLLTFDRDPLTRGPTVEIAHEALIREWGRLRSWLADSREALRIQRRLMASASEWLNGNRDASFLASGARLIQFEALATDDDVRLNQDERTYVVTSASARDAQARAEGERQARELRLTRQSASRLRTLVGVLALFLLVASGLSVVAFNSRTDAINAGATAQANFTRAEAQRLAAESNKLRIQHGSSEVVALLAARSMQLEYTPQGDEALANADLLDLPIRMFIGHTQAVYDVAYSRDGRYLLSGGQDGVARLWDVATGKELHQFVGHTDAIYGVDISADSSVVATSSFDGTARLWNLQTGKEIYRLTLSGVGGRLTFSRDGKWLLTAGGNTVLLWNVLTGKLIRQFIGHTDGVNYVAFSADGKTFVSASTDKTARVWNTETGQEIQRIALDSIPNAVGMSADGQMILTGGGEDSNVILWDVASGKEIRRFIGHTNYLRQVKFSPDGKMILTSSDDKTARIWDLNTGQELLRLVGHTDFVFGAAFSPDGRFVATGSFDKTLRLWDLQNSTRLPEYIGHSALINIVRYSPNGQYVLTGSGDQTVRLWNTTTAQQLRTFGGSGGAITAAAFSPDGKKIVFGGMNKIVYLSDVQTGEEIHQFVQPGQVARLAYAPDGQTILTGIGTDSILRLWNTQTGAEIHEFTGSNYTNMFGLVYAPDGKTMASGTFDKEATVWDIATGKQLRQFTMPDGASALDISPDGKLLVTGSWDGAVRLWDIQTGQLIRNFVGHTEVVESVAFSPDGRFILTGSNDFTARLWDVATGQELRRFAGHTNVVESVAFSPNSPFVLTGSDDTTARTWDIDYHVTLKDLCSRLVRDFSADERAQYNITDPSPTCPQAASAPGPTATP